MLLSMLVAVPGLLLSKDPIESLEEAIENTDPESVRRHLKRFNRYIEEKKKTPTDRKKIMGELQDLASEMTDDVQRKIGIFNSKADMLRIAGGICLLPSLLVVPVIGLVNMDDSKMSERSRLNALGKLAILGALGSIAGVKLIWDGFFCKSQQAILNKAKDIEILLSENSESDW